MQQRFDFRYGLFAADERRELRGKIVGPVARRAQRGKDVLEFGSEDLKDAFGTFEIAQRVRSEIAQTEVRRHRVVQQIGGAARNKDLPAVTDGEQTRHAIDGRPKVIAGALVGLSRVQRHAHPQALDVGKVRRAERPLRAHRCRDGRGYGWKYGAERVAHYLENVAAMGLDRFTHQGVVALQRGRHCSSVTVPALRASLDVRKQERYRSARTVHGGVIRFFGVATSPGR